MIPKNLHYFITHHTGGQLIWILFICSGMLIAFAPLPDLTHSSPQSRLIRVEANQFSYRPGQIQVNAGDIVTIELISTDVVHGFYLDVYELAVQSDPGQPAYLTFTADKSGSFRYRCNVTCGAMHPFMIGKISVGVNQWLYRGLGLAALVVIGMLIPMRWREWIDTSMTPTIGEK